MVLEIVEVLRVGRDVKGAYLSTTQTHKYKHSEQDVLDTWAWVSKQGFGSFKNTHGHGVQRVELRRDGVVVGTYTVEEAAAKSNEKIVTLGLDMYR